MAKKNSAKKTPTINQRFTSLERVVRAGFRQVDGRFRQIDGRFRQVDRKFEAVHLEIRNLRKEMNERFMVMEDRIDRLASHVDGFMKLHETLDIEVKVMKEQMNRFEDRLARLEAAQTN